MSRFWAAGESSDEDDDDGSADSEVEQERVVRPANRWAAVSDSESSVEGERVVRSAKDRAWDGMKLEVVKLKNSMKINDWTGIQTEFDTLNKMIDKAKMHIMKEGLPRFYVKTLVELEDFLMEALKDKEAQRKMSTSNGRALNRMKLALRRHNKNYEAEMTAYRANPDAEESESSDSGSDSDDSDSDDSDSDSDDSPDESDSSDDDKSEVKSADGEDELAKKKKDLVDMDSDDWASSEEEEESSDEEEVAGGELKGRAKWLKATNVTTSRRRRERTTDQVRVDSKAEKKRRALEAAEARYGATAKKQSEHTVFGKALDENLTAEQFDRKLLEVVSFRGRKGTDARELLVALEVLAERAMLKFDPARELSCLMHLVAAQFDISSRTIDEYMDVPAWRSCHARLDRVVKVLNENEKLVLGTIGEDDVADIHFAQVGKLRKTSKEGGDQQAHDGEDEASDELVAAARATVTTDEDGVTIARVVGNVLTFVARLEDEYVKSLQRINPHTQEYVHRLKDEAPLVELAGLAQAYYQRIDDKASAATLALLRIEHMYYKHESIANSVRKAQAYRAKWGDKKDAHPASSSSASAAADRDASKTHPGSWLGTPTVDVEPFDAAVAMKTLCEFVYANGDVRCRTRALLCDVAHSALHGHFYAARDLLLMSHLQDTAHMSDIETQILYNRAMVFLGLCAFRHGLVYEAHSCLAEICSSRVKELLAQGVQSARYSEKNSEQEKAERRRQTPYHMHVNLDLLECCHLTSAMLLEVPNMAMDDAIQRSGVSAPGSLSSRRPVSRHFRKHLDIFNRQVFTGPPENTRDHVLAASKALMVGDWKRCADLVLGLDVWNLIPGENAAAQVKAIVASKIKAEALRAYLFAYSSSYESLSLPVLCNMFDIDTKTAHSLISKMMINGELKGAWDQPTSTIVLYRLDPSPLQTLALRYAEKAALLVESNERLLDARAGGFQGKDDKDGGRRWKDDRWSNNKQQQGGGGGGGYYNNSRGRGGGDWNSRNTQRGRGGGGGQRSNNYVGGGENPQRRRQVSWREQRA